MAKKGTRKDDADLLLRPEPPEKRKKVLRLKMTGMGIAARITRSHGYLHAPSLAVCAGHQRACRVLVDVRPVHPARRLPVPHVRRGRDGRVPRRHQRRRLVQPGVGGVPHPVAAALLLLVVRIIQSVLGLRDSRRLIISGFAAGGVAVAWIVAVFLLNMQYVAIFEQTFGMTFTVFVVPIPVFLTAAFGIASSILAKQDKNQPFISQ